MSKVEIAMGKTAVLSDVHFGIEECNLRGTHAAGRANVEKLMQALKRHELDELILLGDIFDMNLSNFAESVTASKYFFEQLKQLPSLAKITYVPGNHDHIIWFLHILEKEIIQVLRSGGVPKADFNFTNRVFPRKASFLAKMVPDTVQFNVQYPFVRRNLGGKQYIFFHGHYIDKIQNLLKNLMTSLLPNLQKHNLDQLEIFCAPQYELFTMIAQTQLGRVGLRKRYGQLSSIFDPTVAIDDFDSALKGHLTDFAGQWVGNNNAIDVVDYVIYGHTHCAGISRKQWDINPKLIKMNTGCWMKTESDRIGDYVLIDKDVAHPQLYYLSTKQAQPMLHGDSQLLNDGVLFKLRKGWRIF